MCYVAILVLSIYLDFSFSNWTRAVVARRVGEAMAWSGSFYAVSMLSTLIFVGDHWAIIPAVIGHVIGTWVALWRRNSGIKAEASNGTGGR